jgi:hypothetical protein
MKKRKNKKKNFLFLINRYKYKKLHIVNVLNHIVLNLIVFVLKVGKVAMINVHVSIVKIHKSIVMKKDILLKINKLSVIVQEVNVKKNIVNALLLDKSVMNLVDVSAAKIDYIFFILVIYLYLISYLSFINL